MTTPLVLGTTYPFPNNVSVSGSIGIGTTNPIQSLHVQGQSYFLNSIGIGTTNPIQSLHVQGQSYFLNSIGIGTTNPVAPLHITGSINVTDINSPIFVGMVAHFARSTAPTGWLKCNGAAISRTAYSSLFNAISTTFGTGDGSTTFNVPDLRGEFLRGWDDGRGIDSGRTFGGFQNHEFYSHAHNVSDPNHTHGGQFGSMVQNNAGGANVSQGGGSYGYGNTGGAIRSDNSQGGTGISINANGGTETRPRNIAVLACIKYI